VKRQQVIGKAHINRDRCLPWAEDQDCIVCEEMCPIPEKAIILEEVAVPSEEGGTMILKRPVVIREDCIGCGICEYKCPVDGEAAIQVWIHSENGGQQKRKHQGWH
jgi:NAD-dependent dihydropyrimidine dehydrogenase PreA subunit